MLIGTKTLTKIVTDIPGKVTREARFSNEPIADRGIYRVEAENGVSLAHRLREAPLTNLNGPKTMSLRTTHTEAVLLFLTQHHMTLSSHLLPIAICAIISVSHWRSL